MAAALITGASIGIGSLYAHRFHTLLIDRLSDQLP
jgi:short-subunit dehydrogenase